MRLISRISRHSADTGSGTSWQASTPQRNRKRRFWVDDDNDVDDDGGGRSAECQEAAGCVGVHDDDVDETDQLKFSAVIAFLFCLIVTCIFDVNIDDLQIVTL